MQQSSTSLLLGVPFSSCLFLNSSKIQTVHFMGVNMEVIRGKEHNRSRETQRPEIFSCTNSSNSISIAGYIRLLHNSL